MSKKELLDDFLRNKLSQLPDAPVGNFEKVESRMATNNHRGILVLLLIPFLISGLYWMANLTEKDIYNPSNYIAKPVEKTNNTNKNTSTELPQVEELQKQEKQSSQPQEIAVEEGENSPSSPTNALQNSKSSSQINNTNVLQAAANPQSKTMAAVVPTTNKVGKSASGLAVQEAVSTTENSGVDLTNEQGEPEEISLAERFIAAPTAVPIPPTQSDYVLQAQPAATDYSAAEANDDFIGEDVRETSNWSVTMNVYPNYTFREFKLNSNAEYLVNERYEDIINDSEKGGFAFNAGVDVRYHLGNNLFLGTGLGFIQTKINGNYDFKVENEPVFDDNGNIYMYAIFLEPVNVNQGIIQTYRFLQMPLHVSYQPWASEKLRLIVEGGFSYIHFLSADGQTIDYESLFLRELNTMRFNRNMASMDFKVGLTYYPTPNVAFGVEPTLMYFNSSIYEEDSPLYVVPWSVGVNLNLRIRLL